MEEPNKKVDEQTAPEASVASPETGLEPTGSLGPGKHKKHSKKRVKSSSTPSADAVKPADGGAQSSPAKSKKAKRGSKSKTDTTAVISRLESQPEASSSPPAGAMVETTAPAATSAEPPAPTAASPQQPAPTAASAEVLPCVASDALAQRPAQIGYRMQAQSAPPDQGIDANVPATERREPKPALLPNIGSVVFVFLMVAVVVGMMIARRKQIQISKTSTASGSGTITVDISGHGTTTQTVPEQNDTTRLVASDGDATATDVSPVASVRSGRMDAQNAH